MSKRIRKFAREYLQALIIALVLSVFIKAAVVEAYWVPTGSMLDTIQEGDRLLVSKFSYDLKVPLTGHALAHLSDPQRGDVIVFKNPVEQGPDYVKRVIAVPGDHISIRDGTVFINGQALSEPYVLDSGLKNPRLSCPDMPPVLVPENNYFVMGDNRNESFDSRYWGFVPREDIKGRAFMVYWSGNENGIRWDRIGDMVR